MTLILSRKRCSPAAMCTPLPCRAFLLRAAGWIWPPTPGISRMSWSNCRKGAQCAGAVRNVSRLTRRRIQPRGCCSGRSASICTGICAIADACTAICGEATARVTPFCLCSGALKSRKSCAGIAFSAGAAANRASCRILRKPANGFCITAGRNTCIPTPCVFPGHCRSAAGRQGRRQRQSGQRLAGSLPGGQGGGRFHTGDRQY